LKVIQIDHEYKSREDATVKFIPIGDIHRGNPWMHEESLYNTIKYVKNNDCYVILMGDYGECINSKDPRHDYNALEGKYNTPDKQYRKILEDLSPIKDKVICMLEGNHESNFWRRHNHNYTEWLATDMNVEYPGISAYIRFKFKRKTGEKRFSTNIFDIYAHHGWAGGRSAGYQVQTIHSLKTIFPQAHMYLMGHNHQLGEALPRTHLYVDKRTNKIREQSQYFFFTGSYIKGHEQGLGSYVEARAYPPTMIGSPIIEVKPNRVDGGQDSRKPQFSVRYNSIDWENMNNE